MPLSIRGAGDPLRPDRPGGLRRHRLHRLLPQPGGFEGLLAVAVVTLHPQHPPVAQRPDLEAAHPGGDPAAASSAGQPDSRNDGFARIDDLLCFDLERIPHLMDCRDEAHEALVAAIDVWVENVLRKIDDDLGIEKLRRLHEIPLAPEAVAAAHYLDVLLRHRLLRQPGGFESFLGGWVPDHRADRSVADRPDKAVPVLELTARAALRSKPVI